MNRTEARRAARELGWRGAKAKRPGHVSTEFHEAFRSALADRVRERLMEVDRAGAAEALAKRKRWFRK